MPRPTTATQMPLVREPRSGSLPGVRGGGLVAVVAAAVLLLLLVVFIAQNTQDVHLSFLWWDGTAPLSVALLVAAVAGLFLAAAAGSLRILQLRRRVRRDKKS